MLKMLCVWKRNLKNVTLQLQLTELYNYTVAVLFKWMSWFEFHDIWGFLDKKSECYRPRLYSYDFVLIVIDRRLFPEWSIANVSGYKKAEQLG